MDLTYADVEAIAGLHRTKFDQRDSDECWLWHGSPNSAGYGRIRFRPGSRSQVGAHRVAYVLATKQTLSGSQQVDHICRVRLCVNPAHLRVATPKQNSENLGLNSRNKSGYRGVDRPGARWRAQVYHVGKKMHLGYFDTAEEAAEVARNARLELFTHNTLDRSSAV